MVDVALSSILPNPFRDFDLHPIDQEHVARLQASISADGFWASVVARKAGNRYELAFGHHRIEAARALGWPRVPIEVRELTDWQMVRMLATENATQRGGSSHAAAASDAVAAISGVIAYLCWRYDVKGVGRIVTTLNRDAIASIWGKMRQGNGPGWRCLLDLLPEGTYRRVQVQAALGVLKDSRRMDAIMAAARAKAEADLAELRGKSPEGKGRSSTAIIPRTPPTPDPEAIFDANCARLFHRDHHLAEFRRIVTDPTIRSYLPVDQQYAFAQRVIAEVGDTELTGLTLRSAANNLLVSGIGAQRAQLRGSTKRRADDRITDGMNLLRRGTADVERGCRLLATVLDEGAELSSNTLARLEGLADKITDALQTLKPDARKRRGNLRVVAKGGAA